MNTTHESVDVLLVEDNPQDAELTQRALQKHNLANKLYTVEDGQEAIEFIFGRGTYSDRSVNRPPKIILLDIKLPKVDGLEVLRAIKGDDRTKHIPVIVLTSSREEKDIIESYKLGVNSYICKPVEFNEFIDAVAQLGLYWLILNEIPPSRL